MTERPLKRQRESESMPEDITNSGPPHINLAIGETAELISVKHYVDGLTLIMKAIYVTKAALKGR